MPKISPAETVLVAFSCALVGGALTGPRAAAAQEAFTGPELYERAFTEWGRVQSDDCRMVPTIHYIDTFKYLFAYSQVSAGVLAREREHARQVRTLLDYLQGVLQDVNSCVSAGFAGRCSEPPCPQGGGPIARPRLERSAPPAPPTPGTTARAHDSNGRAVEMLIGEYRRHPVENDWHVGTIRVDGPASGGGPALRWTNAAGVSWRLFPNFERTVLGTNRENPYFETNPASGRAFVVEYREGPSGEYVAGFRFQTEFYSRIRQ